MPEPRVEPTMIEVLKALEAMDDHPAVSEPEYLLARLNLLEARVREMEERRG